jgi:hypothetical protein
MMEVTLHPTPRLRDVVLEQIRIVGLSLRVEALVAALVLGAGTFVIVGEIVSGGPGFDSNDIFPTAFISFLAPFAVWRRDQRFGPSFLWTLPMERRRLALAKVLAGWVWMMAAVAVFALWLLALALLARLPSPVQMIVARVPFTATVAAYLFGSALVLGLRHPLRWLLGAIGVFALLARVIDPDLPDTLLGPTGLFTTIERAVAGWGTLPGLARWAITTFLWFGAGLAALWAAASRHSERRHH